MSIIQVSLGLWDDVVRRRPEEDDRHAGEHYNFHHGYEIIVDKTGKHTLPVRVPRNPHKDCASKKLV